jgi:hypothetical protein
MKVAVAGVGCRVMAIRCENSLPSLSLARAIGIMWKMEGIPVTPPACAKSPENRTFGTVAMNARLLSPILPVNRRSAMTHPDARGRSRRKSQD